MDTKKDIFDIVAGNPERYELFGTMVAYVEMRVRNAIGEENAKFYEEVRLLQNSINNVGWEEKRPDQIAHLNRIANAITNSYEDYLP